MTDFKINMDIEYYKWNPLSTPTKISSNYNNLFGNTNDLIDTVWVLKNPLSTSSWFTLHSPTLRL